MAFGSASAAAAGRVTARSAASHPNTFGERSGARIDELLDGESHWRARHAEHALGEPEQLLDGCAELDDGPN
jgi:hypothetical protein